MTDSLTETTAERLTETLTDLALTNETQTDLRDDPQDSLSLAGELSKARVVPVLLSNHRMGVALASPHRHHHLRLLPSHRINQLHQPHQRLPGRNIPTETELPQLRQPHKFHDTSPDAHLSVPAEVELFHVLHAGDVLRRELHELVSGAGEDLDADQVAQVWELADVAGLHGEVGEGGEVLPGAWEADLLEGQVLQLQALQPAEQNQKKANNKT